MAYEPKHLFILDPIQNLNLAWDTSVKLAFVMTGLGARVFATTIDDLEFASHPKSVRAVAKLMSFQDSPGTLSLGAPEIIHVKDVDSVQMRKEPPYDLRYIETLWLLHGAKGLTKVWNDPEALLQCNEKMMITDFSEFSKPMLISSNVTALTEFAAEACGLDVVLKPLNLYGGRGVVRIRGTRDEVRGQIAKETNNGRETRLIQAFNTGISKGEVRAFTILGKPPSWCMKTPAEGNFLANTREGATLKSYTPTTREIDVVTRVATDLVSRGVYMAGFDVIDGWLSEINITCPAMLNPNRPSLEGFEDLAKRILNSV